MHGETEKPVAWKASDWGLSPHARGNLGNLAGLLRNLGTIPACTGKPLATKLL